MSIVRGIEIFWESGHPAQALLAVVPEDLPFVRPLRRVRAGHRAVGEDTSGNGTVNVPASLESSSVGCYNSEIGDGVESGKLRLNQLERVLDDARVREVVGTQHEVISQSEPFLVARLQQEPDRSETPGLPVPP